MQSCGRMGVIDETDKNHRQSHQIVNFFFFLHFLLENVVVQNWIGKTFVNASRVLCTWDATVSMFFLCLLAKALFGEREACKLCGKRGGDCSNH
jgi:hypothetical protein